MSSKSHTNNLANRLVKPTQIAIVMSVAIHLFVVKYGFPRLVINEDTNVRIKETVPTIELTPQEQARLPNLTPEVNIPELNQTPLAENISPFALSPSIPNNPNLFPDLPSVPLPPPPASLAVPNVPPVQTPLPSIPSLPPISPPLPSLPPLPSTDITLPPIGDTSALPLPPPVPSAPVASPDKPVSPPTAKPAKKPETKKPEAKKPAQKAPTPPAKPEPKLSPAQIAAQRQQKLNQEIRDRSRSLQKNNVATTDEEARKNYVAWLNEVKTVEPEQITIEGTYPRDACIRRLEGESVYGVLVNAQGEVTDADLIKSAKYAIFNQQANKDIADRNLANETGQVKPYQITVNFKYNSDICPSLTLPSLRRDNKLKKDAPKSKPQAKPN